jgi:arabinofuranan 3-O-arabinosyltransferase
MVRLLWALWRFIIDPWTRYVAAWLLVLGIAAHAQHFARHIFDAGIAQNPLRRDGNNGHTSIDFGGQWLMGRMLMLGHGHELYNLHRQYEVAQQAFRYEDEAPTAKTHDADDLFSAIMDTDPNLGKQNTRDSREAATLGAFIAPQMAGTPLEAIALTAAAEEQWTPERLAELKAKHVGGPLYPPIQALLFSPLARTNDALHAYFTILWIMLGMAFLAGLGISLLTRRRVWWPIATLMILLFPGFTGGHQLGQNPALTLAIVVWGWALMSRGWQTGGGMIWGLLAFKPLWAAAFLPALLLTRRWRASLGMVGVSAAMIVATIPFVGIESWFDWLKVGEAANRIYNVDDNWIPLSRDLINIPKRVLIETGQFPYFERDRWYAHFCGWLLWAIVVEATVRLSQLFPARFRAATGPAAAFVLLAAWMSCFHFMYYDALISLLGFMAAIDPPANIFRRKLITIHTPNGSPRFGRAAIAWFRPRLARFHPGLAGASVARTMVANSFFVYFFLILLLIQHSLPWLRLGVTATAMRFPLRPSVSEGAVVIKDGKTVMRARQLIVDAGAMGAPLDTLCMLFLWVWCGVVVVIRRDEPSDVSDPVAETASAPVESNGRQSSANTTEANPSLPPDSP